MQVLNEKEEVKLSSQLCAIYGETKTNLGSKF